MENFGLRLLINSIEYNLDELRERLNEAMEDGTDQQNIEWLKVNIEMETDHLKEAREALIVHPHEED